MVACVVSLSVERPWAGGRPCHPAVQASGGVLALRRRSRWGDKLREVWHPASFNRHRTSPLDDEDRRDHESQADEADRLTRRH